MESERNDDWTARDRRRRAYAAFIADAADHCAALAMLKQTGPSPIDAIRVVQARYEMSLTEAKFALHAHPSWVEEARAAEALHDALEAELEDLIEVGVVVPTAHTRLARLRSKLRRRR